MKKYIEGTRLTYLEFIFTCLKTLVYIFIVGLILSLSSCKKEPQPICKTCTETVVFINADNHSTQIYVQKQETFCDGSQWYDLGTTLVKKWSNDGGKTWSTETHTRDCK